MLCVNENKRITTPTKMIEKTPNKVSKIFFVLLKEHPPVITATLK
jgi:hypothetical protein